MWQIESRGDGQDERAQGHDAAGELSSLAKNVAFLAGIYLYFVGWIYLYVYFRHFGVSLLGLEIPVSFFFVYSYPIVTTAFSWIKALVLLVVLLIVVMTSFNRVPSVRKVVVVLLTVALFPLSFEAARQSAEANAVSFRQGYGAKVVMFTLASESTSSFPEQFVEANRNHELLLLLETKDRIYVVRQPGGPKEELPIASTYGVERKHILLADVDVNNISTKEQSK